MRSEVDDLLSEQKTIVGIGVWSGGHRVNEQRMALTLAIEDTTTNLDFIIKAFPNEQDLKFTILLNFSRCIWRLCYSDNTGHVNNLNRPVHLPPGPFNSPHFHSWEDNRHINTSGGLPRNLLYANFLPPDLTGFADCFLWFCEQTRIRVGKNQTPILPPADRLL